ncbi:MAG TPA: hypothetical protein PKL52_03610 [Tenuifilaceae bacterium]|nr:hypothetical protein [Tenuifilaceae bacterium]
MNTKKILIVLVLFITFCCFFSSCYNGVPCPAYADNENTEQ